jgi:hypothetical protein
MPMKKAGLTMIGAVFLGMSGVAASADDRAKVVELVVASRVDAPLVGTFKDGVRATLKLTPAQMKCYLDLPADSFREASVDYFERLLSDAEVAQGLAFFATPVGKRMARVYDGERSRPMSAELTQKEYAQHEAFRATRPGSELLIPNNLLQSREAKKQLERLFAQKVKECGSPAN